MNHNTWGGKIGETFRKSKGFLMKHSRLVTLRLQSIAAVHGLVPDAHFISTVSSLEPIIYSNIEDDEVDYVAM